MFAITVPYQCSVTAAIVIVIPLDRRLLRVDCLTFLSLVFGLFPYLIRDAARLFPRADRHAPTQ